MTWTRILMFGCGVALAWAGLIVGDKALSADQERYCHRAIEEGRFPSMEVESYCGGNNAAREFLVRLTGWLSVGYLGLIAYGLFTKC